MANLVVVPIAAAATSLGLLALLLALVSQTVGALLFNFLWALLLLLRLSVWAAASLPAAMVHLPAPGWPAMLAWFGAAALVPSLRASLRARVAAAGLLALAVTLSLWPWLRPGDGRLRVVFLDVGQGDAALVELPEGQRLLVDGGPGGARRFDVGERVLAPFLWNRSARRLDVVAISHSDPDHSGGLAAVLRRFPVGEVWENGQWGAGSEETLGALALSAVPRRVLSAGERLWLGSALITVLNPDPREAPANENDASLVLRLDWRAVSFLFTGDLGTPGESRLLAGGAPLNATILKVAHHGSRSGSSRPFLEASRPALAVISVGTRNPFRHPASDTLDRLQETGARIYRTDRDGAVLFETDGVTLLVTRWATGITESFPLEREPPLGEDTGATPAGLVAQPGG